MEAVIILVTSTCSSSIHKTNEMKSAQFDGKPMALPCMKWYWNVFCSVKLDSLVYSYIDLHCPGTLGFLVKSHTSVELHLDYRTNAVLRRVLTWKKDQVHTAPFYSVHSVFLPWKKNWSWCMHSSWPRVEYGQDNSKRKCTNKRPGKLSAI